SFDTTDLLRTMNLPGTGHEMEEKVTPIKSSRPKRQFSCSGTIETINLDAVPQAVARLDNSAAKHKLSVKPKKQRMSRKHRRLTKVVSDWSLQNISSLKNGKRYPAYITADRLIQNKDEQRELQLAEKKRIEDHWGIFEAERIRQIVETEEQREMEEQRCQELEQMQKELEKEQMQEEPCKEESQQQLLEGETSLQTEEQPCQEEEGRLLEVEKRQELEQQRHRELEEQQRWKLEEEKRQELQEQQRRELEEQKQREQELQRCRELEEQQRLQLEELRQHEIEKQCQEEQQKHLEEQKDLEEQSRQEKQRQELEKELQEAEVTQVPEKQQKREEQRKHKLTKQMHMESEDSVQQDRLEKQEEQKEQERSKVQEQKIDTEGQSLQEEQQEQEKSFEEQQDKDLLSSGGADQHSVEEKLQEDSRPQNIKQPEKESKTAEEMLAQKLKREAEAQEQKRLGEELRWQEVDERQTASRPFTFQVSSGEKQILFQKVNLSPVMPVKGAGPSSPSSRERRAHTSSKGSPALPSSTGVPHTAILVTGAQLCGTAVSVNQIKDTACKSLLGLAEERKNVDVPSPEKAPKRTPDPRGSSAKMRYAQEALNNQAILAEWASIRSRILKSAESSKYSEKDRVSACRHSDDWTPRGRGAPHGNLRKTLSANAKFSITPAWQKFSESSKTNLDAETASVAKGKEVVTAGRNTGSSAAPSGEGAPKDNLAEMVKEKSEAPSEVTDNTEGCKFAKDLPSFLVPSFPHSPGKELSQSELPGAPENQQNNNTRKAEKSAPNGEENTSPFGIKLRRTNYSLRFHYDQQVEQRKKKRYSAGDSFDGVPDPLVNAEGDKDSAVFAAQEGTSPGAGRASAPADGKDSRDSPAPAMEMAPPAGPPPAPAALPAHEKPACRALVTQKPALAPKPSSQTPPPSPLSKLNRSNVADAPGPRLVKAESDGGWKREEKGSTVPPAAPSDCRSEEEEAREKKSFFPSLSIPWRERNDKKPEPLKKEKPVLQSRHSLDGSKLMEKVETSQPLWITLALQKQKGFREQQATREERRQAREAKQAEKLAKEHAAQSSQSDAKSSSSSKVTTMQKPAPQEGEKKLETAVSRLERREQLKKSNTLPTSVTVEISDSVPSTPLAKEVAKRFSTPEANPVSTEPAWLALAKRKAKAWSDCPQIIK
ncbi:Uncharacterized protein KIAA1211, partial [Tinamus guttatus]